MVEPGDDALVGRAGLEDSLLGDLGVFDKSISEGGVDNEISDDVRLQEKSPERAFLKGIVIDTLVPFPSPSEDMLIYPSN
jgi:hypothetical protein